MISWFQGLNSYIEVFSNFSTRSPTLKTTFLYLWYYIHYTNIFPVSSLCQISDWLFGQFDRSMIGIWSGICDLWPLWKFVVLKCWYSRYFPFFQAQVWWDIFEDDPFGVATNTNWILWWKVKNEFQIDLRLQLKCIFNKNSWIYAILYYKLTNLVFGWDDSQT